MEAKHTLGPWSFGADPCPDNATAIAICKENIDAHTKPSSGHFFVVFTPDGRRTAMVGHGPDGAANARLIAAAPELLAALQELHGIVQGALDDGLPLGGHIDSFTLQPARAAIAKATT